MPNLRFNCIRQKLTTYKNRTNIMPSDKINSAIKKENEFSLSIEAWIGLIVRMSVSNISTNKNSLVKHVWYVIPIKIKLMLIKTFSHVFNV